MKLKILFIGFLFCTVAVAQNWSYGVKGGFNLASAKVKNASYELNSAFGVDFGGYASTLIASRITLQPEVIFSLQSWKSESFDEVRSVSYLLVPFVIKYALSKRFNLQAGPQLGYLLSAEAEIQDILTNLEFSALVGVGYQISDLFGAGLRYNMGINNIINDPQFPVKIHSRVLQISCSYRISR